ncbi:MULTISPECIES: hypothetical protein [unclassified Streptomyces]|uniref:hypothetical protein n=1 Tax=unclassified Streptomyces TaxID=2593676 RepID=UPI0035E18E38
MVQVWAPVAVAEDAVDRPQHPAALGETGQDDAEYDRGDGQGQEHAADQQRAQGPTVTPNSA